MTNALISAVFAVFVTGLLLLVGAPVWGAVGFGLVIYWEILPLGR